MSAALLKRLRDEYGALHDTLPQSVIDSGRRRAAIETLCSQGLPATREENWRYANLRMLERARFAPCAATTILPDLPAPLPGFSRYVFIDGVRYAPSADAPHAGTSVHSLRSGGGGATADLPPIPALPESRLALLNEAFATDAAAIRVQAHAEAQRIELVFVASTAGQAGAS